MTVFRVLCPIGGTRSRAISVRGEQRASRGKFKTAKGLVMELVIWKCDRCGATWKAVLDAQGVEVGEPKDCPDCGGVDATQVN